MQNQFNLLHGIVLFLTLSTLSAFGQNSKKESIREYKQLTGLSIDEIKTQSHSELANELTLESFMVYYIENGKERVSKKYGQENIDSIYRDSVYTYFIHRTQSYPIRFIKVKTDDIGYLNISNIDGNFIRQKFLDEIVPIKDKERVKRKSQNCSMGSEYSDFEYIYDTKYNLLGIIYKWKVTCDFFRVINKTYKANYHIDSKTFRN